MTRRFTEVGKWDDPWFMDLSVELKLLWLYILDSCDHAGIWKVNLKLAEFKMGLKPPWGDGLGSIPKAFEQRVFPSPRLGDYWFIPKFLRHQYGDNLKKGDAILSALKIVEEIGFSEVMERVFGDSYDPLGRVKAKAKAKAEDSLSLRERRKGAEKGEGDLVLPPDLESNRAEITDWLAYKRQKGQSYKSRGLEALWRRLREIPANRRRAAIDHSMANNYVGIFEGGDNGRQGNRSDRPARYREPGKDYSGIVQRLELGQEPGVAEETAADKNVGHGNPGQVPPDGPAAEGA